MSFNPPEASLGKLEGVPFDQAVDVAPGAKKRFDNFDKTPAGKKDPSTCKALLKFPDGTIFWSSKVAVDADGPAAGPGRRSGSQLDPFPDENGNPEGQDDTKFQFPGGGGLSSETVPYIVLPLGSFRKDTGLAVGNVAIVIFQDKITAAIAGDIGPSDHQIGEASIRVHEAFHPPAPDPCQKRDANQFCELILNESIPEDVLFFVFPKSGFDDLTPQDIEARVTAEAFARYNKLRGAAG
jgi:glycosyl hydrolase group 75 (putative chitosanase)